MAAREDLNPRPGYPGSVIRDRGAAGAADDAGGRRRRAPLHGGDRRGSRRRGAALGGRARPARRHPGRRVERGCGGRRVRRPGAPGRAARLGCAAARRRGRRHGGRRRALGRPGGADAVARGLGGLECLSGHSRADRRDAHPERRRLRPGGSRDDPRRARAGPGDAAGARARGRRLRVRLSGQPLQARPGRASSSWRSPSRCGRARAPALRYPELAAALGGDGRADAGRRRAPPCWRCARRKSMVIRADDPNRRSAGSFFTNPVVDCGRRRRGRAARRRRRRTRCRGSRPGPVGSSSRRAG